MTVEEQNIAIVDNIKENVVKWTDENIGNGFAFRPNQLEAIVGIIYNILNEKKETQVIQAPTGTGKSLICIISAGVLARYYNMKSYILASDLYLWSQYMQAIDKYKLKDFGYLKGSIGNYRCDVSHTDYNIGKCKLAKVSIGNLRSREWRQKNGYLCADKCIYMRQRFRAEKTPVSLLTYQLWLYQMNLVDHSDGQGFQKRDVIFCDECHNIPDIIGKYAQPVIDVHNDREKISHIIQYAIDHDICCGFYPEFMRPDVLNKWVNKNSQQEYDPGSLYQASIDEYRVGDAVLLSSVLDAYDYFIDCLQISESIDNRVSIKLDIFKDYYKLLAFVAEVAENALSALGEDKTLMTNRHGLTKEDKQKIDDYKVLSWMHNYSSMLHEFIKSASTAGQDYIVVEENKERVTNAVSYQLCCVKEDYLCYNFLMKHAKFKVMTSATVGSKKSFMDNVGTSYTEGQVAYFQDIPNFFDFSRSPIYFIPKYKMSYAQKKQDFPKIQQMVYQIMSGKNFADKRGMINTGSYENAKAIYDAAPAHIKKRLCIYGSSKDKNEMIEKYKYGKNMVLIGPTLVEGVDLPNDLCRFIIIVKVPYPNIGSKSVKAKMQLFPLWYNSTTSNTIIQNIGRGVRNENDYCTTFILDGCFENLYKATMDQYPVEIRNRIQVLNS